jgi:ubiquinone/menaquinone biosynthesis C-methylase UbiE
MDTAYSTKAKLYDRYRWDYSPDAIEYLRISLNLNKDSAIADIGAGTGILTKHFIPIAGIVYAAEPDCNMYTILDEKLNLPNLVKICSTSDRLSMIDDDSLDLIVAAHAINWFDFDTTLPEFGRILKKDGYIATFANQCMTTKEYEEDMKKLISKYKNPDADHRKDMRQSIRDYCTGLPEEKEFPFVSDNTFEIFIGSLMSTAHLPDHSSCNMKEFENDAKRFFDRHSTDGCISLPSRTILTVGKLKYR